MKIISKTLFVFIALVLIVPSISFAAPDVTWNDQINVSQTGGGYLVTGVLNITGIEPSTPNLALLICVGSNVDFNPPLACNMATNFSSQNGIVNIPGISVNSLNVFVLPILVDVNSYIDNAGNTFLPYSCQSFAVCIPGQSADVAQDFSGGNGSDGGQQPSGNDGNQQSGGDNQQGGGVDAQGWPQAVFDNPLGVNSLDNFVVGLLNALLRIGVPVLVVFLVYSGLRLVMARGNEKELADAKKNLLWVIIGTAILLGAWTIVRILKGTLDQIELTHIYNLINHFV
jgi:hypothetical protein